MPISDEVQKMILSALESMEVTSANPTHINELIQVNNLDIGNIDQTLEQEIKRVIDEQQRKGTADAKKLDFENNPELIKRDKKVKGLTEKLKAFDEGPIGDVNKFTAQQMGNLQGFVRNPTGFIMGNVFKKFAKGAGVVALALMIMESVKFILSELMKPGRLLDLRFKRVIGHEILANRRREEKQKLKQGFARLIITSAPRLRGGVGGVNDTFRTLQNQGTVFTGDTFMHEAPKGNPISITSKGRGKFRGRKR